MIFKKRILHIVDDEKFIDSAYKEFEKSIKGGNIFIILSRRRPLYFIKSTPIVFVRPKIIMFLVHFLPFITRSIVFHSLGREFEKRLILRIPSSIKILWISWGFDLYPYLGNKSQFLLSKTQHLIGGIDQGYSPQSLNMEFIHRVDYFSTVIPKEFDSLSERFSISPLKYLSWNYLTLEDDIVYGFEDQVVIGNNILFGHSGSIWLNHYDAFVELENLTIPFDRIVCPLSYGDLKYSKAIIELGTKNFGPKFQPITEYLPYEEYVRSLLSCKVAFFNSVRQIGLGNILLMLYLGAKIVLRKENPVYQFLRNSNLPVYSIEDLDDEPFSRVRLLEIREILKIIWGRETISKKTKFLIEKIQSK